MLQEKLEPSKKTVQRTELRDNFLKRKTNVQNCRKKPDTTKEDCQKLFYELQVDKFKLF